MPLITTRSVDHRAPTQRRPIHEVLGIRDVGASRRGSTYYKSMQLCPREHGLKYVAGLRGAERENLVVGWLFHYLLELYYRAIMEHQRATPNRPSSPDWLWGGANRGTDQALKILDALDAEPGYQDTAAVARKLLAGYIDQYERCDKWRILAVEETVEHNLHPELTARLDLVFEDLERGGMWIGEHKSTARITEDLVDNYQMDLQVLGQVWLVRRVLDLRKYPAFKGVRVNISKKPSRRRGGGVLNDDCEYTRVDVCPSNDHLAALERTQRTRPQLLHVYQQTGWPQHFGNCSGFARGYSKCEFYALCHNYPQHGVDYWARPDVEPPDGYCRADAAGADVGDVDE